MADNLHSTMRETPFNIEPWEINVKELKNKTRLQVR